jgi:hypothetical protein
MTDIKTIWNVQPVEDNSMITLSDLRARAHRFQAKTQWRNVALYVYSLANIGLSIWLIASGRLSAFLYPMLLMVAAHLLVLWQINRRIAARALPPDIAGQPALDFHRHELERQAYGLSRAWLWYIAPFIVPFLWELAIWLERIQAHATAMPQPAAYRLFLFSVLGAVFFWTAVWLAFSRAALGLQLQIERLNALKAE